METNLETADLAQAPMISTHVFGRVVFGVGPTAVEGSLRRLGIEPTRSPVGRRMITFAEAQLVAREIRSRKRSAR